MNTDISIPDDVFERAERRAADLGMSRDEFYTAALTNLIGEDSDDRITERLNEVYAEENSSELDPVHAQMQATSLDKGGW